MSFESRRFFWSAPAERSGDGALVWSPAFMRLLTNHETGLNAELRTDPSGVALRLPPHSKERSSYEHFSRPI